MATGSTLFDVNTLNTFTKKQLVDVVLELQKENKQLMDMSTRITELERSHYLYLQYGRRNSIEITGIPDDVQQKDLEDHVINIYNEAGVKVHDESFEKRDIEACHRIGKKGTVITRFVNRKFAKEGLYKGRNLKDKIIYDGDKRLYNNDSLCKPFQYIGYVIRKLKKAKKIEKYKIKNGVFFI